MVFEGGEVCWDGILKIGNWRCFHRRSHNQQHWGKMEATMRLNLSNWSRTRLEKVPNCGLKVHYGGLKRSWRNFENQKFGDVFAGRGTTSSLMLKWMILLDSAF